MPIGYQTVAPSDHGLFVHFRFFVVVFFTILVMPSCQAAAGVSQEDPDLVFRLSQHGFIQNIAFSPDETLLATASDDGEVVIWNVNSLREVTRFFIGGWFQGLRFDIASGALAIQDMSGVSEYLLASPHTKTQILKESPFMYSLSAEGHWLAYSAFENNLITLEDRITHTSYTLQFPPDRSSRDANITFDSGSNLLAVGFPPCETFVYSLSGKHPSLVGVSSRSMQCLSESFDKFGALLLIGRSLPSSGGSGSEDEQGLTKDFHFSRMVLSGTGYIAAEEHDFSTDFYPRSIGFSKNGSAVGFFGHRDPGDHIWIANQERVGNLEILTPPDPPWPGGPFGKPAATTISDRAEKIAFADYTGAIRIYDVKTHDLSVVPSVDITPATHLALSAENHMLAASDFYGRLLLWDLNRGTMSLNNLGSSNSHVQFLSQGGYLAFATRDGNLNTFNYVTGAKSTIISDHSVNSRFWVLAGDKTVFWVGSDSAHRPILATTDSAQTTPPRVLCHLQDSDSPVAVSSTGEYIAAVCKSGTGVPPAEVLRRGIYIWRLPYSEPKLIEYTDEPEAVAFSPDSSYLLAVGEVVEQIALPSYEDEIWATSSKSLGYRSVAFSPDSKFVVLGQAFGAGRAVDVWSNWKSTKRVQRQISGIQSSTDDLAVDSKGHVYISSMDGSITVTDTLQARDAARLFGLSNGSWAVATSNGLFDARADSIKWMGWRQKNKVDFVPTDTFFDIFYYPGLLSRIIESPILPLPSRTIADMLNVPGLDSLLAARLISKATIEGKFGLCLGTNPVDNLLNATVLTFKGNVSKLTADGFKHTESGTCPYFLVLPGKASDYDVNAPASKIVNTPYERETIKDKSHVSSVEGNITVHVQTITYTAYNQALGALPYPSSDGADFERFFHDEAFQRGSSPTVRVWPQLSGATGAKDIQQRLQSIANASQPQDVVLLFFSGHGQVPTGQQMYFFLPASISSFERGAIENEGFNTAMFADALRDMRARRILLVVDSCQSGGSLDSLTKVANTVIGKTSQAKAGHATPNLPESGIAIITAATPFETAAEKKGLGYGILVKALLEALRTDSVDTEDIKQNLGRHVQKVLQALSSEDRKLFVETPEVFTSGTPFKLSNRQP